MRETLENLSKTTYRPEFRQRFGELTEKQQKAVSNKIGELVEDYLTQPWNHPQVKYLPSENKVWRLKIGEKDTPVNHRVFFDVDSDGLVFLSVSHRETAYE